MRLRMRALKAAIRSWISGNDSLFFLFSNLKPNKLTEYSPSLLEEVNASEGKNPVEGWAHHRLYPAYSPISFRITNTVKEMNDTENAIILIIRINFSPSSSLSINSTPGLLWLNS
jgi:hypothetical protein